MASDQDTEVDHVNLLSEIATIANSAESLEEPVEAAAVRVSLFAGADVCHVYRVRKAGDGPVQASLWKYHRDPPSMRKYREKFSFDPGVGFLGQIVVEKRTVAWADALEKVDLKNRAFAVECDIRSVIGIPLMVNEEVVAIMEFFFLGNERVFDARFLNVMDQIGILLGRVFERESARSIQERQLQALTEQKKALLREIEIANALRKVIALINEGTNSEQTSLLVLGQICELAHAELGHLYLFHFGDCREAPGAEELVSSKVWFNSGGERFQALRDSRDQFRFQPGKGIVGIAFQEHRLLFWNDLTLLIDKATQAHAEQAGIAGVLAFPILVASEVVAVAELFSTSIERLSDSSIQAALEQVGIHLGRLFERDRARSTLELQRSLMVNQEKLAALGEMASSIAHEINNPLAVIFGRTRMLLDTIENGVPEGELKERLKQRCLEIDKVGNRITRIIKGLRSFARDASQDPMVSAGLAEIVAETLEFCKRKIDNSGVSSITDIPEGISIRCRPIQVSQVILNLVSNAVDAIEKLEARWIRVEARKLDSGVEISVTDSGKGIPPEARARIFTPFFTTKGEGKGTGLGLSISRGIIEEHGGQLLLDLESPYTRFVIRLPACVVETSRAFSNPIQ